MTDLHELTALDQGEAIRRGDVSPVELVEHYLARIDAHGQALGAFVTVTADEAMAAAVDAAGVKRAGADQAPRVAPAGARKNRLEGVPTAIKDLTLTAGVRTTFGSLAFGDFVPPVDGDVVVLMRQAGLISLGKTTTSEFGCALYSESSVAPPARNPWATNCTAGGSSGGAAAAVAAGLVAIAQGNDGGGSLRIPASICGLVGYKPSRGLVSGGPMGFGGFGLPTHGPIARTVADAAALLDVMAVPMLGEPFPTPPRPPSGFIDAARHPETYLPKGRPPRIGRYLTPMLADVVPAADVVAVWETAATTLAALGCEIVDVEPPFAPDAEAYFEATWPLLSLAPVPPEKEALLLPLTRWLRAKAREITPDRLVMALAELQLRIRRYARNPGCDLLLSPVLARAQAPVGWFTETGDPADDFARQERFSPYCAAYNFTGQPAVSLPVGRDAHGSPIGVMLAAPMGADAQLIAVSALLEAAGQWAHQHPPVWSAAR
jgi:amidase